MQRWKSYDFMITQNIAIQLGLFNSTMGEVLDVVYENIEWK